MRPEELTFLGCWEAFAKTAIPEGAPRVQYEAMRQAFQAGCATILEVEEATRKLPRPHAERLLDRLREETHQDIIRTAQIQDGD